MKHIFIFCGAVNKQNYRFWASEQLSLLHITPLHSAKVTVWCGVASFGILGPYFCEKNNVTVTVTSERYVEMLNNFLPTELQRLQVHDKNLWFQQDGATSHTARISIAVLREKCFRIV